jgi:hypothetical protein
MLLIGPLIAHPSRIIDQINLVDATNSAASVKVPRYAIFLEGLPMCAIFTGIGLSSGMDIRHCDSVFMEVQF